MGRKELLLDVEELFTHFSNLNPHCPGHPPVWIFFGLGVLRAEAASSCGLTWLLFVRGVAVSQPSRSCPNSTYVVICQRNGSQQGLGFQSEEEAGNWCCMTHVWMLRHAFLLWSD